MAWTCNVIREDFAIRRFYIAGLVASAMTVLDKTKQAAASR
jgi:hypothetical protein